VEKYGVANVRLQQQAELNSIKTEIVSLTDMNKEMTKEASDKLQQLELRRLELEEALK